MYAKLKIYITSMLLIVMFNCCNKTQNIIGFWKDINGRNCLEFHKDSTITTNNSFTVPYIIENDSILVAHVNEKIKIEISYHYLGNDTLVLIQENLFTKRDTFERIEDPAQIEHYKDRANK